MFFGRSLFEPTNAISLCVKCSKTTSNDHEEANDKSLPKNHAQLFLFFYQYSSHLYSINDVQKPHLVSQSELKMEK